MIASVDSHGSTPLHYAASVGHKAAAQILLTQKADVNATNNSGDTPLLCAVYYNHKDVVELLLSNKADITAKNNMSRRPLSMAVECGYKDMAELLLVNNADVNADHSDALFCALRNFHVDLVALLLTNKADVNATCPGMGGVTPLMAVVQASDYFYSAGQRLDRVEIAKLLLNAGADKDAMAFFGTALRLAVKAQNTNLVKLLLASGANKEAKDTYEHTTALISAAQLGSVGMVEFLLAAGANTETIDANDSGKIKADGLSPTTWVFLRPSDFDSLIPDSPTKAMPLNHATALIHAAGSKRPQELGATDSDCASVVKLLLKAGADKEAKDHWGHTALAAAAYNGHTNIVGILLASRVNVNSKDNNGNTPLHWAERNGHAGIVALLRQHGGHE